MAVTKTDLLQFVAQFQQDNKRPCPKSNIVATYGEDALTVLKELVTDRSINCRRGRNGGYYPTVPVLVEEAPSSDEAAEIAEVADISDQFAALQARLAAAEEAESQQDTANL